MIGKTISKYELGRREGTMKIWFTDHTYLVVSVVAMFDPRDYKIIQTLDVVESL